MSMATPEGRSPLEVGRETLVWFRPSIRGAVYKAWAQAFGFVMAGSIVLGLLRVENVDFGSPWLSVYGIGILLVMAGPLWLATRLARMMKHERVLTLRRDGVVWIVGEAVDSALRWNEIDRVEVEGDAIIVQGEHSRIELPASFEDISPPDLVNLIRDLRRRALLGMPMKLGLRGS